MKDKAVVSTIIWDIVATLVSEIYTLLPIGYKRFEYPDVIAPGFFVSFLLNINGI